MGKYILKYLFLVFTSITLTSSAQILTFDFAGNTGSEATDVSNFNDPNLGTSTISRGAGLTASANADRFNATNWALTSANAVTGNNYMEFTITPNAGYQFSISSIVVSLQRSSTGPSGIALRSSADGYVADLGGTQAIVDNTLTQSFTFTFAQNNACNTGITYRIYMFAEATTGTGGPGDFAGNDIIVNGSVIGCAVNTISTGAIAGSPFTVTCVAPAAVNVPFTSTGTYNPGNIYTAQLSDASGSFAFPVSIGTLSSTANSGTIAASIPAGTATGTLYRIRVVSDNPIITGTDNGADLTINGITGGTMIVNETSNGASGSKEYMEFVVLGAPCSSVSIQNIIFDDNNGDFGAATGIAAGHYRFTTAAQWGCIPSGSIIVVYNDADLNASLPADDLSDSNSDSVYVLPISSALFEMCTTVPNSTGPTPTYTGCTYVAPTTWSPLGMANSGDACQLRYSNGNYMHGLGYGTATGGPNGILLTGGAGNNFYFSNAVDDDYTDVNNFSTGTAPANETPGAANNVANQAFIDRFRCIGLAVDWMDLNVTSIENVVRLDWSTLTETNSDYFTIERADANFHFIPLGKVTAAGNTSWISSYTFYDNTPLNSVSYYRIKQTALDGTVQYSQTKAIFRGETAENPWFNGEVLNLSACDESAIVRVFDASGKMLSEEKISEGFFQPQNLTNGFYFMHVICNRSEYTFKFTVTR